MMVSVSEGITEGQLKQVYADPYIRRVGHDHRAAAPIYHPLVTYYSAYVGSEFVGAFMAIRDTAVELSLHALLHKSAIQHSRELGREFLRLVWQQPAILRVTAYIISGLESAKNYCLKLGFQYEGCRRCACLQGGIVRDVHILGMTREDWSKS